MGAVLAVLWPIAAGTAVSLRVFLELSYFVSISVDLAGTYEEN